MKGGMGKCQNDRLSAISSRDPSSQRDSIRRAGIPPGMDSQTNQSGREDLKHVVHQGVNV